MRMRTHPAMLWKISIATSSPKKYPMAIIVVIRRMFITVKTVKPSANRPIFLIVDVVVMNAKKVANIMKAMRE